MRSRKPGTRLSIREICIDGKVHRTDLLVRKLVKGRFVQSEIYRFPAPKPCDCCRTEPPSVFRRIFSLVAA